MSTTEPDIEPNIAQESLKRLHQIVKRNSQLESSSTNTQHSFQPRNEPDEAFVESSLPPQRNRYLKSKRPTFFLSRGDQGSQLLKRAAWLKRLNERVMGKLGLPYSAHLRLSSITPKGVAVIHADSPAWVQKGRFLQQNLLDLLQMEGAPEVKQVKLKVRFSNEPQTPPPKKLKPPSQQTAQQLSVEAEKLEGPLGQSLKRLSNTLLRKR